MTTPVILNPSTPIIDVKTGLLRPEWYLFFNSLVGSFVSSVAVSGANGIGVSGSPITSSGVIALSLGALTPSSVAAAGAVSGSNLSGTNTGDQTISLTGDVTGSGTGSFAATIANGAVTFAKLASTVLQSLTNTLSADVALSNTANYFDGPSTAQGTSGTWLAIGNITVTDTAAASIYAKLWDGTTAKAAGAVLVDAASAYRQIALAGIFVAPTGNIRISARDTTTVNGNILFNQTGNSADSSLTVIRIA